MARVVAAVCLLTGGCALDRAGLSAPDAGPRLDALASVDAARDDAAPLEDGCVPAAETCNLVDDDCDGETDEGFDLAADPTNCGACGVACADGVACGAGVCGDTVVSVCAGDDHACVARPTGPVLCWGGNASGQLGDGTTTTRPAPAPVSAGPDVVQIVCGRAYTCARTAAGSVRCWGRNGNGQLGVGDFSLRRDPTTVPGVNAVDVDANITHTCAIEASGTVACWGLNDFGQLGDGTRTSRTTAGRVGGLTDVADVATSRDATCAVLATGQVHCWGHNDFGQLGRGDLTPAFDPTPRPVRGLDTAVAVSSGYQHTCALRSDGTLACWGRGLTGQIGNGADARNEPSPADVVGLTGVTRVEVGNFFSCARTGAGMLWCWGSNSAGQLAQPASTALRNTPEGVSVGIAVDGVTGGHQHTCAHDRARVFCWGANNVGQVGIGASGAAERAPREVSLPLP